MSSLSRVPPDRPLQIATGQVTASSLLLAPLVALFDRPWTLPPPSTEVTIALLALALLCTALAYLIYFRILATAGATMALLVTFLVPVSAILLGAAFLHERLQANQLGGMVLIGIALAAIDGRPLRIARRLPRSLGNGSLRRRFLR